MMPCASFDRIFPFPGGHSKFAIRRDPESGLYLTFSNINDNIEYILLLFSLPYTCKYVMTLCI